MTSLYLLLAGNSLLPALLRGRLDSLIALDGPRSDALLALVLGTLLVILSALARALTDFIGKRGRLPSRTPGASFATPSAGSNSASQSTTDAA